MIQDQIEGWLDEEYIRVYASSDRQRISEIYGFGVFLPDYTPLGSVGLDALCLAPDGKLYLIPWVPLDEDQRIEQYDGMSGFMDDIAKIDQASESYEYYGKELHLVTPIVFGGEPDQETHLIDQDAHAEICSFWNKTYARIKKEREAEQDAP